MQQVIVLRGLPGSGKTTYAKEIIKQNPGLYKRVNRDEIRRMFSEPFSKENEKFVKKIKEILINEALIDGYSVIVDDTNLKPNDLNSINKLVSERAKIEVIDWFLQVPLPELIDRNFERPIKEQVPEKIIVEMYNTYATKYLDKEDKEQLYLSNKERVENKYIVYDNNLPDCVIFDIDGTLALKGNRNPYKCEEAGYDIPNEPVARIARNYMKNKNVYVFLVTARHGDCMSVTENWLSTYELDNYDLLFFRENGDRRPDYIVKEEILKTHILNKYNVLGIFDDRDQTVAMWRRNKLPTFQVDQGNF